MLVGAGLRLGLWRVPSRQTGGAVGRAGVEEAWLRPTSCPESVGDRLFHAVKVLAGDEGDRGSTEPSPGHPSTESSGTASRVDCEIEFDTGNLEVVAQRGM